MNTVTQSDLEQLRTEIVADIRNLLESKSSAHSSGENFDWMRSKEIRKILNISAGTLQNLRIAGKIRHKQILGSYYYNKTDLQNLFNNEKE